MTAAASIDFTVGSRRLLSVGRELARWSFTLEDVLAAGTAAALTPPSPARDGLRVLSAPVTAIPAITACFPHHLVGGRQDYRRHYIAMEGCSYTDYLARFSGKTRSTLRRKARKLAEETGGYTITEHRSPAEIEALARDVGVVAGTLTKANIRTIALRPAAQACFAANDVPPVVS